ncbi:MAG: acyltransferase [Promethearchaeota archaeon]
MRIPERMMPVVEMFPYLKEFQRLLSNLFLFPEEAETEKNKQRIIKYQETLTKRLIKNAKKSYEGKSEKTRNIRPATTEEKKRYRKITGGFFSSLRNQYFLSLLKYGTPKFKRNFLKDLGAKIGKDVFISPANLIDTIFTKKISIGDNTVINTGAVILCHEFSLDTHELYVGEVNIGKNVIVLPGALILPGVNIGDNAYVGPGFISYDIKDNFIGIGIPDSIRYPFSEELLQLITSDARSLETLDASVRDFRKYIPRYSPINMLLL